MKIEPGWLSIARSYLGLKEIKGDKDNPKIVEMFKRIGHPEIRDDETAWCAAFVGSCLEENGLESTKSAWALSYQAFGQKLTVPLLGAIGVKKRYDIRGRVIGGHVGFIVAASNRYLWMIGGNQKDQVSAASFTREEIIAMRWPRAIQIPKNPLPLSSSLAGATHSIKED